MKLIVTEIVYAKMEEIKSYIAEDSYKNAVKVIDEILKCFENINLFPNSGNFLCNKIKKYTELRYKIVYSFAILYRVTDEEVVITNILHLKRDFNLIDFN
ncbi:MAG: type II toxin-antitoxin system RelE/ParE family toxin [Clostridia bacterium]|nr:type II toxin-antitoxin system RelE/ParE family toxin [Clostridia bacterium]